MIILVRIGLACLLATCGLHLGEEVWKYKTAEKESSALEGPIKGKVVTFEGDEEETTKEIAG